MRRRRVEALWVLFALANLVAMAESPSWETIPFHFIWVSLTILYGFRVWGLGATGVVLGLVAVTTGVLILHDAFQGTQLWGELWEVPLMSAMFLAMVWHARRRQSSLRAMESLARDRAQLVERQERLLHDVSHELRTPVTIARGHLEVLCRDPATAAPGVGIAMDELDRMGRLVEQLLLLAKAEQPDFAVMSDIDIEPFIEDVFLRWSEVAPRAWRLGTVEPGVLHGDPDALRISLDALLENAVDHTTSTDLIELAVRGSADSAAVIDVSDGGSGIPPEALDRIFERFGRAECSRTRREGGVGLGLAIVDAIARAHGGGCTVASSPAGSTFSLRLSGFTPAAAAAPSSPAEPLRLPSAASASAAGSPPAD
ncbi:MAG: sensor histidine kinase [Solirubrobacteraceae bacterium]